MKRAALITALRRALGAGPSTGRRCLCPHPVDEHHDITGCRHTTDGVPCMCPAGPKVVADERAEYRRSPRG